MSELDKMIASLQSIVKPKNEFVEYQLNNLNEIDTTPQPRLSHRDDKSWTALVNRAYTSFVEKVEEDKLTDSFRAMVDTQTNSATKGSLTKTISRFYQQHSILQAYS